VTNTLKTIVWITAGIAVVSLGVAAALFFTSGSAGSWKPDSGITVDEYKSFALDGIETIDVQTSSTDVYLTSSEGGTVEVRLHGTVYAGQIESVPALATERSGEILGISLERKDRAKRFLGFFSSDLILEIGVPSRYRGALEVDTSSADVAIINQILSKLSAETSSGDMNFRSIQATGIEMQSSSGDQSVAGMHAENTRLTSSSGEIRVTDLQGDAKAESSSGDISLRYSEFAADLEVRSSSGDVELYLTDTAEFRLEARASSGDIDCAFPVIMGGSDDESRRNRLSGTVGQGTHSVKVQTSSGDITIRR
jgi:lia operon protein LiaG